MQPRGRERTLKRRTGPGRQHAGIGFGILRAAAAIGAGAVAALAFLVFSDGGAGAGQERRLVSDLDRIVTSLGFGIRQVDVRGHRYTSDADIYRALELDAAGSQLSFDAGAAEKRIEALAWVKSASVHRRLPDGISVQVVERKPFAVWRHDGKHAVIDDRGRVLAAVAGSDIGLPVVAGAAAAPFVREIVDIVADHPALKQRLIEARRVAGRRWTLVLADGPQVHLPAANAKAALSRLMARAGAATSDPSLESIDLRTGGRLIIRRADKSAAAPGQDPGRVPRTQR